MKKIMFCGRSECGKTTLKQALKGNDIAYHKTQYVDFSDIIIDTPGEYAENCNLGYALEIYSYEADVVGLLISATEPYSLYPPCATSISTRPCIGIVTQIDALDANTSQAISWLKLAGCQKIFPVSSYTGKGLWELINYLKEDGDILPWSSEEEASFSRVVHSTKNN